MIKILSAATSHALTTVPAVREHMSISDDISDEIVLDWVNGASSAIEAYCGVVFARELISETFRLHRHHHHRHDRHEHTNQVLYLTRYPVNSITSVTADGVVLSEDEYELDPDEGLIYRLSSGIYKHWTSRTVVVVYDAGYTLPGQTGSNLPAGIQRAAILAVGMSASSQGRDPFLRTETTEGVGSTSWYQSGTGSSSPGLPADAVGLLAPYRAPRVL